MPVYQYKDQFYELAETDPAAAKAKILQHLEKTSSSGIAGLAAPKEQTVDAGFEFSDPMGGGLPSAIAQAGPVPFTRPKGQSVLERYNIEQAGKQIPFTPEEGAAFSNLKNIQSAQAQVAQGREIQARQQAARQAQRQAAKEEDYGITDFFKDTGIDVSKGVVGLGEAYVGLLNLTSGGAAGRVLGDLGYDPERTKKFLTGFQSLTRQEADRSVQEAAGFVDTLSALGVNPTALVGTVAESLPGTVLSGAVGGKFVRFLAGKAANEATSLGLTGAAAEKFIADRIKEQSFKIAAVASGAEGFQSAGAIAEAARQGGREWSDYILPSLGAGFGTAAIGAVGGKAAAKMGIGDIETSIATRSAGIKGVTPTEGPAFTRILKEAAKEGVFEEMPQSAQEQVFQNLALGKPWDEGVDRAAAMGLVAGLAMGGGNASVVSALQGAASSEAVRNYQIAKEIDRASMGVSDQRVDEYARRMLSPEMQDPNKVIPGLRPRVAPQVAPTEEAAAEEPTTEAVAPAAPPVAPPSAEAAPVTPAPGVESMQAQQRAAEELERAAEAPPEVAPPPVAEAPTAPSAAAEPVAEKPAAPTPPEALTAESEFEPAPVRPAGFRAPTPLENKNINSQAVLDLGNGARVHFTYDDFFISAPGSTPGQETGVIRLDDTRKGVFYRPELFPDFIPQEMRQPLIDAQRAVYSEKDLGKKQQIIRDVVSEISQFVPKAEEPVAEVPAPAAPSVEEAAPAAEPAALTSPEVTRLQAAYDKAKASLDAIGSEPTKPSSESRYFGSAGREGAAPEVVKAYDEKVKAYNSWRRKYSKLKKAEVDAANELFRAKQTTPTEAPTQVTPVQEVPAQAAPASTEGRLPDIVVPAGFKAKKGRKPQLVFAARALAEGKITKDQYDEYVERYNPIKEVLGGEMELPIEDALMTQILTKEIPKKKDPKLVNAPIADGTRVGLRMDIPALDWGRENGVNGSVVSIHEGSDPKNKTEGKNISYKSTGRVTNVVFAPRSEEDAFKIAQQAEPETRTKKTGEVYLKEVADKKPQQTIEGDWVNTSPEETLRLVREHFNDPNWVQVSLDPLRHSYFYARDSKRPVLSADEALQVGRFVLVKNPVYGDRQQFLYNIESILDAPVGGDPDQRSQSYKREAKKLTKAYEDGRISSEQFAGQMGILKRQDDQQRAQKEKPPLVRGAYQIKEQLNEAARKGWISEDAYQLAEWFINSNPRLVEDLAISLQGKGQRGVVGTYDVFNRLMILIKNKGNDNTIVHEILHHLERMMPQEVQNSIRKEWTKRLLNAQKQAKTELEKFFFDALIDHHFGENRIGDLDLAPKMIAELNKMGFDFNLDTPSSKVVKEMLKRGTVPIANYQYYSPSEFWAVNGSDIVRGRYNAIKGGVLIRLKNWLRELGQKIKSIFGLSSDAPILRALDSLAKADGQFVTNDLLDQAQTLFSIEPTEQAPSEGGAVVPPSRIGKNIYDRRPISDWTTPTDTKLDDFIYRIQDKLIDTKRVIQEIEAAAGRLEDRWDPYLQEELYHGRTATATKDFLRFEVRPLLEAMKKEGVTIDELDTYLHNRFAPIRNENIANINPNMPDAGSGILTEDAKAYMDALTPEQKAKYERLAAKVDAITQGTRGYLVGSGQESQETINAWEKSSPFYVPLNREDVEYTSSGGMGTGRGFSVSGPTTKRATGSLREVSDILANIIMQRERAIVRGEKNRVGVALYGLAMQNPNPDMWLAVNPDATKNQEQLINELIGMGLTKEDAEGLMQEPRRQGLDPQTGLVVSRINIPDRYRDNVLGVRINGKDRFIFFNSRNPRAERMVTALKNLDADQLGTVMSKVAMVTRYFSQINTQYNPVFGIYNFLRDIQGGAIQLSGTDIEDRRAEVLSPFNLAGALKGIYATLRAERADKPQLMTPWSELWIEFQREGGQTGYRDMFSRSQERAQALKDELDRLQESGGRKAALAAPRAIRDWLSDYNETLENAVRLTAYKAALDKGLSKERAASIAKNLTVNFNRKGQLGVQVGALYSFFNSAVQGTTRLLQTITKMERPGDIKSLRLSKIGKTIVYGGLLLGSIQAMLLAAFDFDENEPPDFVKDKNLIIPIGEGKYLAWPYPLGYHVIPAISRIITEWGISGFKDTPKRVAHLADLLLDAFNPIGNAGLSGQTIAPTIFDPLVALLENKDWTGKKIAKEDFNKLDPTPGYTRAKESATWLSKQIAYYLNVASGGDKDKPGLVDLTPDQIDYLAGQLGGGLAREVGKTIKTTEATITGEELPPYNIPLVGRFYGNTKAGYAESQRFYKNLEEINILENQLEGRTKRNEDPAKFKKENPKVALATNMRETYTMIRQIRKERDELIKKGADKEKIQAKEQRMVNLMRRMNSKVAAYDKGKPPQKEEDKEATP